MQNQLMPQKQSDRQPTLKWGVKHQKDRNTQTKLEVYAGQLHVNSKRKIPKAR